MSILNRRDVRQLQAAALANPLVGDASRESVESLNLIPWRRGGLEGGAALSFNR